jgi:2-oxo-4-hydroxy-4-carboxy-5-ureidoimidazoline decarboxylase
MNPVLDRWNKTDDLVALDAMLSCCGALRWANAMIAQRPIADEKGIQNFADLAWDGMCEADWLEAFACHPRIGERDTTHLSTQSSMWSQQEQSSVESAADATLGQLAESNALYESKFGFTYILCASGKTPEEMLAILTRRLNRNRASELREAAEQQRLIMHIRLRKWLEQ